jgi:hypothetical protein
LQGILVDSKGAAMMPATLRADEDTYADPLE